MGFVESEAVDASTRSDPLAAASEGMQDPSECSSPNLRRGIKRRSEVLDDPVTPCSPDASSTSSSPQRRSPRVQARLTTLLRDGKAALEYKSREHAGRTWLRSFIKDNWGHSPSDPEYDRLKQRVYRSIHVYEVEVSTGAALHKPGTRLVPGGHRCRVVNPKERVRFASMTRQWKNTKMPELDYEVFQ